MTSESVAVPRAHSPRKLCFVVDYRSSHARNWIDFFATRGDEVHVISTYPAATNSALASLTVVPVGLSSLAANPSLRKYAAVTHGVGGRSDRRYGAAFLKQFAQRLSRVRPWIAPLDVLRQRRTVRRLLTVLNPDLVHAMRLPYEGFLAAEALSGVSMPLIVSTWGSDLVLYAKRYPLVAALTRRALARADGLHTDCERDARVARDWGLSDATPTIVLPGAGGLNPDVFHGGHVRPEAYSKWRIPTDSKVILNTRNFRPFAVCTEELFTAIGLVQRRIPNTVFVCTGMEGHPLAMLWRDRLPTPDGVRLLPSIDREELGELYRLAHVTVSPSISDGMPTSLLEAMACGSLPVAGELESIKEWISHEVNGLFCDARNPQSIAQAIERGLLDDHLRRNASEENTTLIQRRAEYSSVMRAAEQFYTKVTEQRGPSEGAALSVIAHSTGQGSIPTLRQ